jgi:hypothetical protein
MHEWVSLRVYVASRWGTKPLLFSTLMHRHAAIASRAGRGWANTRGYRLPAGTFPRSDPRSIYDSQVHRPCLLLRVFGMALTRS